MSNKQLTCFKPTTKRSFCLNLIAENFSLFLAWKVEIIFKNSLIIKLISSLAIYVVKRGT